MFDWQDLRHFAALARHGTLSGAARELGVDHATVGRRVAALEQALGLRLVDRLPRRAVLTADGRIVAGLAAEVETAAHAIARHARAAASSPAAKVRVSAPPAIAARLVAPQVATFQANNPAITLVLSGMAERAALDRGEADIAVRLSRPEQPDLVVRRIGVIRFGLFATRDQAALPPADWRFIAYDAPLDHVAQQAWLHERLAGRRIVFRASDLFSQVEAARAGLGAAVLPTFMAEAEPALVALPADDPPARDIWLATYPDLRRSPPVRAVMDFLADVIGRACPTGGATTQP